MEIFSRYIVLYHGKILHLSNTVRGRNYMDRATWQFINSFSSWLSAIGTVAAVIVALYLARRDKRIRLEVSAGIRLIVTQGIKGNPPEFLTIRVTNIGHREAQLTNIGWKIGFFRKKHAVQTTIRDGISSELPLRLKDGEKHAPPLTSGVRM